jgi:acetyltransferase EpsM
MSNRIVIIGGGSFATEVAEVAEMLKYKIIGICAPEDGLSSNYAKICTREEDLYKFSHEFDSSFIGIGAFTSKDIQKRKKITHFLKSEKIKLSKIVSPTALISKGVEIGSGSYVAHNVVISFDAIIGSNSIINTAAIIGHNVTIGDASTISSLVFLGGNVVISNDVLLGTGCVIMPGVKIGAGSTIGAGSVVANDVEAGSIVFPNLSKTIKIKKNGY